MPQADEIAIIEMNAADAHALALLLKRLNWSDFMDKSVSEAEAYELKSGVSAAMDSLARIGFAPR